MAIGVGLALNALLNYLWLPIWGLAGAVAATAVANLVALALVFVFCHLLGMRYHPVTLVAVAVPSSLALGPGVALAVVTLLIALGWRGGWVLTAEEREQLSIWTDGLAAGWGRRQAAETV